MMLRLELGGIGGRLFFLLRVLLPLLLWDDMGLDAPFFGAVSVMTESPWMDPAAVSPFLSTPFRSGARRSESTASLMVGAALG